MVTQYYCSDPGFPTGMREEIELFLERYNPPNGLNIYDEVFQTQLFFPLQRKSELAWMMEQARKLSPTVVMEIGADKGGGLYHWCKCLPTVKKVIACEIRGTPYKKAFEKAFPNIRFLWLECPSQLPEILISLPQFLDDDFIDCLFIDGDKTKFEEDFNFYLPYMNKPSAVFFHDIQDTELSSVFTRVSSKYEHSERYIDKRDYLNLVNYLDITSQKLTPYESWLLYWKGRSCGVGMIPIK